MTERQKITKTVERDALSGLDDYGGCTLSSLRDKVLEACGKYGGEARIFEEDDKSVSFTITIERDETDDEQRQRLAGEERWRIESEARDRAQYEALKLRFEPEGT